VGRAQAGLSRTRTLLAALGNPQQSLRFVHIAGTDGKGSTCACIAAVLRAAGYRVGLNTSPYLERFNERIQVDGAGHSGRRRWPP
jgi:dihydrofolate synthase/folylpolyglutamate synthase